MIPLNQKEKKVVVESIRTRLSSQYLVETAMYRINQLTGSNLKSRELGRQQTEALIKCLLINKMSQLGMPRGLWINAA